MLRYNLLFIHIVSAMGMFTALGIEALALSQLRRASDSPAVLAALAALGSSRRVSGASLLVLLLTGLGLATKYWQWQGAWIGLGVAGWVAIGAVGDLMTGRRISGLRKRLGEAGMGTLLIEALPALQASFVIRAALLTGVVYLMTVKPGPVVSLGVLGTAVIVGLASSRARSRSKTRQATRALG